MDLEVFFFFNDTATTEIYTLSLHDALPISASRHWSIVLWRTPPLTSWRCGSGGVTGPIAGFWFGTDRKSTRLNSSHLVISYAVFCLKKKKGHRSRRRQDSVPRRIPGNAHEL